MGKSFLFGAVMCAVLLVAATTRSDVVSEPAAPTPTPTVATPEPITGMPAQTAPGWETLQRDPFTPYDITPHPEDKSPKPHWHYNDLKPEERAVADRGRDTSRWRQVHDAFAAASAESARNAAAASAANQLGNADSTVGVVP